MGLKYIVGQGLRTMVDFHRFEVSGPLEIPEETAVGGLKYNQKAFTIKKATALVKTNGTAQYQIKVISYDNTGANPVTHINQTVSLSSKVPNSLTISTASIGADRSIELTLTQQSGTESEDFTLTLE